MQPHFSMLMHQLIQHALAEDIGDGDHSTLCCIPADARGSAILKIKEAGVLAGMQWAEQIFRYVEPDIKFIPHKQDGDTMQPGETAFEVEGRVHTLLQCERVVLNCMQRMSGIATLTRTYVQALEGFNTRLLDTRKTTPNFRLAEKEAVRIGGAYNHRFALYEMIMLKDNHIDFAGGILPAIERAKAYVKAVKPELKIEVEVRSLAQVEEVLQAGGVHRIMLDNFSPAALAEAVALINHQCETEASGGINLSNIKEYAATGVDYISVGALIHQARSVDLSLKAIFK